MFLRVISLALFGLLAATAVQAEYISGSEVRSGNWRGAAYTYDESGTFSHCVVCTSYNSGVDLYLSVNSDATVGIGVAGDLQLNPGIEFPVAVFIDRNTNFYGSGYAVNSDLATLHLSDFNRALDALRRGPLMELVALGQTLQFNLIGTFNALEATGQCALANLYYRAAPQVASTNQPNIDRTANFQLATNIITELGIRGEGTLIKAS